MLENYFLTNITPTETPELQGKQGFGWQAESKTKNTTQPTRRNKANNTHTHTQKWKKELTPETTDGLGSGEVARRPSRTKNRQNKRKV